MIRNGQLYITVDELIAAQPVEVLEVLAVRHFSRSALRRRRLDARDEDFRELAREIIAGIGLTGSGIDHQRGVSTRYGQPWPLCREPLAERPSSTWARRRTLAAGEIAWRCTLPGPIRAWQQWPV